MGRREALYALGALLLVIVVAVALWNWDPFGRRKRAETEAATATTAATVAQGQTEILDRYHTNTIVIREKAEAEVAKVYKLPGADTPLAPERRDTICGAVGSLWNDVDVCSAGDTDDAAPAVR